MTSADCFSWSKAFSTRNDASDRSASGRRPLRRLPARRFSNNSCNACSKRLSHSGRLLRKSATSTSLTNLFSSNRSLVPSIDVATTSIKPDRNLTKHSRSRACASSGASRSLPSASVAGGEVVGETGSGMVMPQASVSRAFASSVPDERTLWWHPTEAEVKRRAAAARYNPDRSASLLKWQPNNDEVIIVSPRWRKAARISCASPASGHCPASHERNRR